MQRLSIIKYLKFPDPEALNFRIFGGSNAEPLKQAADQSLGAAIKEFLQTYHLEEKVNEQRLMRAWGELLGRLVSNHTKRLYIRNRILYAEIDSAPLRNELGYAREKIINALNNEVKAEVIIDLVLK